MDKAKKYTYILYLIAFVATAEVVYNYFIIDEPANVFLLALVYFSCGVGFNAISYMNEGDSG